MSADTRERARLEILNFIVQFCLTHVWSRTQPSHLGSLHGFVSDIDDSEPPIVGDLVVLTSTSPSKWYLGWLREIDRFDSGESRWLVENIEDGALCWWSNVGVEHIERAVLEEHPSWRWTDRQFAFKDRWWRVCFKDRDAYITLPIYPIFGDGYAVTLGTRTRFSMDEHAPRKTFPDWRKVTKAQMTAFYDECTAEKPVPRP